MLIKYDSEQRKTRPLVAASIGPYGAVLPDGAEFHGRYVETMTKEELKDFHRRRLRVLASEPGHAPPHDRFVRVGWASKPC